MSKIYEALLQAELDRSAANADQSDAAANPPSSTQDVLSRQPQAQVRPFPEVPAARDLLSRDIAVSQEPNASREISASLATLKSPAPSIDFANITAFPWKPSLQQLPALEERGSAVEQFRTLRSRMVEFRGLNTLKSILISSGLPQEGKSFIAANLALSFARHKASRVLLIDGDMRRPSLHKILGCPSEPGLAEYLSGKATLLEVLQRAKPDDRGAPLLPSVVSLTLISGGNGGDKAAELSGNHRFDELIAAVSPFFDWIVVDSSPVNLVADGVNLARACDGVLLVARGGVTQLESAQRAVAELKASKILGVVLNAVRNPLVAGGYYGYDGYDSVKE